MQMSRDMRCFFYCFALISLAGTMFALFLFFDQLITHNRFRLAPFSFVVQTASLTWLLFSIGRSGAIRATNADVSVDSPKLNKKETVKVFVGMIIALILLAGSVLATIFIEIGRSTQPCNRPSLHLERIKAPPVEPYFD